MPKFMSSHTMPAGALKREQVDQMANAAQGDPVVKPYRSFLNLAEGKIFCVMEAPSKDALAAWFLQESESGGRPWDELDRFRGPEQADEFDAWIAALRQDRRLKNDDASTVTHSTGADNGDEGDTGGDGAGEYWTVITGDGTKYVFGLNKLPGAYTQRTNSVWTAPLFGDEAKPAAEFKGDPNEAVWLPNEAVAKAWMEYVKTGATTDTSPPPAPFNVMATGKGNQGTEVTWSAEADFESGIRNFIVLRDGQELAQVPEKPVGKFGRPLFQSMTYHDTPTQPLPEMRYLDASAHSDEKHTYSIITVNSVGLKSKPSSPAP